MISIPELNPKFYYGPVVSHEFRDISKEKEVSNSYLYYLSEWL